MKQDVKPPGMGKDLKPRPQGKYRFPLIPFDKLKVSKKASYTIKGLVPETGIGVAWGPKAVGKSFKITDMFLHVAFGWKYRGRKVHGGIVVYCAFEGAMGYHNRAEAFRREHKERCGGRKPPFYLQPLRMELIRDYKILIRDIEDQVGGHPKVVVIDTLNRSFIGSESSDEDMSAYFNAADAIREAFDCVVVIVHHCGVDGTRPRGHTSLTGGAEFQFMIKRDARGNVVLTVEYTKDGPEGDLIASKLKSVFLGYDDEGDAITSCVIEPIPDYVKPVGRPKKSNEIARKALRLALVEVDDDRVSIDIWRKHAIEQGISPSKQPRARNIAFSRAVADLLESGRVKVTAGNKYSEVPE